MRSFPRYDCYEEYPRKWTPWESKFLWWPRKIEGKYRWLTKVYERHKAKFLYHMDIGDSGIWTFEYQYAFNMFDLIKKDSE